MDVQDWLQKFYKVCYFKNTLLKELNSTHINLRNITMSQIKINVPDCKIKMFDDVEISDHKDKKESIMWYWLISKSET